MKKEEWERHHIITGVNKEMRDNLPKGLKVHKHINGDLIKVPRYPHKLNKEYQKWCIRYKIGNGFYL